VRASQSYSLHKKRFGSPKIVGTSGHDFSPNSQRIAIYPLARRKPCPSGRLTAFDQMKEMTSLKREFPFLKEPPGQTLQQAIHDLHKGRADNQNVQIT
jgi:hypothetical protein